MKKEYLILYKKENEPFHGHLWWMFEKIHSNTIVNYSENLIEHVKPFGLYPKEVKDPFKFTSIYEVIDQELFSLFLLEYSDRLTIKEL